MVQAGMVICIPAFLLGSMLAEGMQAMVAGVMIADYWIVGRGKPASWHPNDGWNRTGIAATLISLVIALMIPVGVFNFNGVIIGFIVYLILEHFWPSASRRLDGEYSDKKGE